MIIKRTKNFSRAVSKKEEMIELEHKHIFREDNIKKWSVTITP